MEDITDLRKVNLNHQVFSRLLDLIDCDVEDLEKQKEVIGTDSLSTYKKFLKIIIDNELDFTLENNSRKVGLTHLEAKKFMMNSRYGSSINQRVLLLCL